MSHYYCHLQVGCLRRDRWGEYVPIELLLPICLMEMMLCKLYTNTLNQLHIYCRPKKFNTRNVTSEVAIATIGVIAESHTAKPM